MDSKIKQKTESKEEFILRAENIYKSYGVGEAKTQVLKGISANFKKGKMYAILGQSGSGKSTFMNILGGLDFVDSGKTFCSQQELTNMKPKQLVKYRRANLGFIFQMYNLIPNLTVRENIQVCEYLSSNPLNIEEIIDVLGLKEHQKKFPSQLSGGQQQRCAIGRALIKNPNVLLCDEPTGALDYKTSKDILILLEKINREYGTTMLIITHNMAIKDMVHGVITIKDGMVSNNYENKELISAKDLEW